MVQIIPGRYAEKSNATLLADRLRLVGRLSFDNLAEYVEQLSDRDRRILRLDFAGSFNSGKCVLRAGGASCFEGWLAHGLVGGFGDLLDQLSVAAIGSSSELPTTGGPDLV